MYNLSDEEKAKLSEKVIKYTEHAFSYNQTVDEWDRTLTDVINNWKKDYERYYIETI